MNNIQLETLYLSGLSFLNAHIVLKKKHWMQTYRKQDWESWGWGIRWSTQGKQIIDRIVTLRYKLLDEAQCLYLYLFWKQTDNMIGEEGAIGLSEGLKTNARIMKLVLSSELHAHKTKLVKHLEWDPFILGFWTENRIGKVGGVAIGEMLMRNTLLRELSIECEKESFDYLKCRLTLF